MTIASQNHPNALLITKGNAGIGTASPDNSAIIDLSDTTRGFLMPRMTSAQISGITNPAIGLQVYSLDDNCIHTYDGTAWKANCAYTGSASSLPPAVGVWIQKNDLPFIAREVSTGFSIGEKGYLGMGVGGGA